MLYDFDTNRENVNDFHQRVADRNIQSIEDRQEEIEHAKNSFIGMLAGILVGGLVGWIFLSPADNANDKKELPIIRRQITSFKIQPNDPGGMEIDNQDREIYHIVDNTPKEIKDVTIRPAPDQPVLVVESSIDSNVDIESLVESIDNNAELEVAGSDEDGNVKIAQKELVGINTNSGEKIVIPQKINQIDVTLQDSINKEKTVTVEHQAVQKKDDVKKASVSSQNVKGTWYAQIIASSRRSAVEKLWMNLSNKYSFLNSYPHEIEEITSASGSTLYRLKVGRFETRKKAEELSKKLKQNNVSSIIKQN
jgi:cell division protein FtsN